MRGAIPNVLNQTYSSSLLIVYHLFLFFSPGSWVSDKGSVLDLVLFKGMAGSWGYRRYVCVLFFFFSFFWRAL